MQLSCELIPPAAELPHTSKIYLSSFPPPYLPERTCLPPLVADFSDKLSTDVRNKGSCTSEVDITGTNPGSDMNWASDH